jgi:L-cysteine/cystine lyase
MSFEEARAQFPVLERLAYLNAGTNGPLARSTVDAVVEQIERDRDEGRSGSTWFEAQLERRDRARRGIAAVIDVEPSLVALTDSTTRGCAIVLAGLELQSEDEIVITDQEHFGLLGSVRGSGARVVVVDATEEAIVAVTTSRTRLIATSHVLWTTGKRLDLAGVREATGVPVLVDGAQSAGAIEVHAEPFDFYTVSGQKWLCSPEPTGGLYVRDPERLRLVTPSSFAPSSYEPSGVFVPKEGAARHDSGWIGGPTLAGLLAALAVHPEWRYERAAANAARCHELLSSRVEVVSPRGESTLVSFRPNGDPTELVASLHGRGVIVRELPGRSLVRASVGWWTSEDDLQRLAEAL